MECAGVAFTTVRNWTISRREHVHKHTRQVAKRYQQIVPKSTLEVSLHGLLGLKPCTVAQKNVLLEAVSFIIAFTGKVLFQPRTTFSSKKQFLISYKGHNDLGTLNKAVDTLLKSFRMQSQIYACFSHNLYINTPTLH